MSNYLLQDDELEKLRGKVILITGGSTGIGRATVCLAHSHGAKVAFCDVNVDVGKAVEQELKSNIFFQKCDISNWAEVLSFFQATYDKFGPIDAVIANAGINKVESLDDSTDGVTVATSDLKAPDISVLNVNLVGTCAMVYW
ncbi:uncharacterized protein DNG_10475 [Cephalotrichum gorgonifer]|uniref:Uncharacterized protein n=1 Tax=Cephalotrichum gorgonifer TaxID=2041049 RepID=A0AAE8N9I7_9PEZI|nr:uncharacterized protein DNG_10475 [Cephalotrichum gorgonifer]